MDGMQDIVACGFELEYKPAMCKAAMQRAVDEAVRQSGSYSRLAQRLGISRQALQQWASIPVRHVLLMERLSGVSRYELRPDVYGPPPGRAQTTCAA